MEYLQDILSLLGVTAVPYAIFLHRKLTEMSEKLNQQPTHESVRDYVQLVLDVERVKHSEMEKDIKEVKQDVKEMLKFFRHDK